GGPGEGDAQVPGPAATPRHVPYLLRIEVGRGFAQVRLPAPDLPRRLIRPHFMSDMRTFSEDAGRAWRAGGWPSVMDELRRRIMDRIGGYVRRFVIETDLSRMVEVAAPPEVDIRPFTG